MQLAKELTDYLDSLILTPEKALRVIKGRLGNATLSAAGWGGCVVQLAEGQALDMCDMTPHQRRAAAAYDCHRHTSPDPNAFAVGSNCNLLATVRAVKGYLRERLPLQAVVGLPCE